MRYAIFSDIHSNLEAYEAFIEDAIKEKADRYLCVGDIVGYGANPGECIKLIKDMLCPVVCGNHDWAAGEKMGIEYFNYNAQKAVLWTKAKLNNSEKDYLKELSLTYKENKITLVHGSLYYPQEFNYVLDLQEAAVTIHLQETPLCFIGHTHAAGVFYEDKTGAILYTTQPRIKLTKNTRYLINAGSIGQPRDGDWRSSYCIYDDEKQEIIIKRVEYDVKKAQNKILFAGLPSSLAVRLAQGR